MIRRLVVGLLAVVGAAVVLPQSSGAAPPPFRVPEARVTTLGNGLTIAVFRDRRLPLVNAQLTVPAGSAAESTQQVGAAYLTAQMLGRMTSSRTADEMNADLDRIGGAFGTQVGRDFAWLSATFLSRELPAGLELMGDAATHAVFPEVEVDRIRRTAQSALTRPSNTALQGDDALWGVVFAGGPYAHALFGTPEGLEALSNREVRAFHASHWSPDHAWLVIAGDVNPDSAIAAATRSFGSWARTDAASPPSAPAAPKRVLRIVDRPDIDHSEVMVGVLAPKAGDDDEIPMALAAPIAGLPAAELTALRSGQSALRDGGILWVAASAAHDSVSVVARRLERRLLELRDAPPTQAALDSLAQAVHRAFPMRFETLDGLVSQWSAHAALGLPAGAMAEFPSRLERVTAASFAEAMKRWVSPDRIVTVVVGPATTVRPKLFGLAPVEIVAATPTGPAPPPVDSIAPYTSADEKRGKDLVKKLVAAHGGLKLLRAVRNSTLEATANLEIQGRSIAGSIRQVRQDPTSLVSITEFEKLAIRQLWDGTHGWSSPMDSLTLAQEADSLELESLRLAFRSDVPHVLVDAADSKTRVVARGRDRLDGVDVEKVEVWPPGGFRRMLFIDATTNLLAGMEQLEASDADAHVIVQRRYKDYRKLEGGLRLPYIEERWLSGRRAMELKVTRWAINSEIPVETFARPEQQLPPVSR